MARRTGTGRRSEAEGTEAMAGALVEACACADPWRFGRT
jgi:hypothetical protein